MMEIAIGTGRAAEHFQKIIEAQGGNPAVVDDPALLPQSREVELFSSPRRGFVARVEPRAVGRGITALGGGRAPGGGTSHPRAGRGSVHDGGKARPLGRLRDLGASR